MSMRSDCVSLRRDCRRRYGRSCVQSSKSKFQLVDVNRTVAFATFAVLVRCVYVT